MSDAVVDRIEDEEGIWVRETDPCALAILKVVFQSDGPFYKRLD